MKNILSYLVLLCFITFSTSCTNSTSNDTSSEEPTEQMPLGEAAPETPSEASTFETIVVKDGIASPRKEMKGQIAGVDVAINYGSPSVKGRTIWGDLVPFDQIWRTGANEATTFEVANPVNIEGQNLAPGKYSLFTIPKEDGWTIIFNEVAEQWGHYDYDEGKDVLRVDVNTGAADEMSETMEFVVEGSEIVILWANLKVPFNLEKS